MNNVPKDLVVAIEELLAEVIVDSDELEDEVETAQRAILW